MEGAMARTPRYEGSPADERKDRRMAKSRGESLRAFERSAADRKEDAAGQRALNRKAKAKKKGRR
jgi:hypothetical protein